MNRRLRTVWPLSLLGMACVLLAGFSSSPPSTSLALDGRISRAASNPDEDLLELVRDAVGQSPAPEQASPEPASEPSGRKVHEPRWSAFASVGGVSLVHPASRVERVGFHESSHDGARQMEVHPSASDPITLESRGRGTGSRTASDVVVDPQVEIRVPVSGTVIRSGNYALYCKYADQFAVIDPDGHRGWEVKVLHVEGLRLEPGDRVKAGVTVLAGRARKLPFRSQIDDYTAEPSWPHVHIEVIDPAIPDRRPPGGGC
ncbi:MAG: M23 family metallopeptidase [Actinomycetota bacterium]|nr:M23 family metallopeptidase [Actinomycetota bacterium]